MILADTSIWIQHFRRGLPDFAARLNDGEIATHTIVVGELASGNLASRAQTLRWLRELPRVREVSFNEAMHFIETQRLFGIGLGWNDVLLLAAARMHATPLWSLDRRLCDAAEKLGLCYSES